MRGLTTPTPGGRRSTKALRPPSAKAGTCSRFPSRNYYQIDFVCGPAIDHFGHSGASNIFYHAEQRYIGSDNGGTHVPLNSSLWS